MKESQDAEISAADFAKTEKTVNLGAKTIRKNADVHMKRFGEGGKKRSDKRRRNR